MAKKKTKKGQGGRIHIRTATAKQAASFHAYAERRGLNLTSLVVSLLMRCLDEEKSLQPDAEQI